LENCSFEALLVRSQFNQKRTSSFEAILELVRLDYKTAV
jgi:hypothetical protein